MGEVWEFGGVKMLTKRETRDTGAAPFLLAGFGVWNRTDHYLVCMNGGAPRFQATTP